MHPTLIDFGFDLPLLGRVTFPAFLTVVALSFAIGMWMTWREAPRVGIDREKVYDLNLWIVVWAFVGARVLHVLADGYLTDYVNLCIDPRLVAPVGADALTCATDADCGSPFLCDVTNGQCHPRDCLAVFKVWRGGLAFYGGLIFASAFAFWFMRRHRMPMMKTADLLAPWVAFGLGVSRLGCFLNGCCFGKVTDSPLGVVFPYGGVVHRFQVDQGWINEKEMTHAVHPTQVYQSAMDLVMFFVVYYGVRRYKKRRRRIRRPAHHKSGVQVYRRVLAGRSTRRIFWMGVDIPASFDTSVADGVHHFHQGPSRRNRTAFTDLIENIRTGARAMKTPLRQSLIPFCLLAAMLLGVLFCAMSVPAHAASPTRAQTAALRAEMPVPFQQPVAVSDPNAPVRAMRIRFYADPAYKSATLRWKSGVHSLLRRANAVVEPAFRIRFEVEDFRTWDRKAPSTDLRKALAELTDLDRGDGVDFVIGLMTPLPLVSLNHDNIGMAQLFGRHLVLRSVVDPQRYMGLRQRLGGRAGLKERAIRKVNKAQEEHMQLAVFLHEISHALGGSSPK